MFFTTKEMTITLQQVHLLAEYQAFTGFLQHFTAIQVHIVTFYYMARKERL